MVSLVTGGTGFIGGAVVRALVERGASVRVLARPTSRTEPLKALGVEIAHGDILDPPTIARALDGCDRLYHVAALYDLWVPDREAMARTQVEGTRNTLEAAFQAGLQKVIYTSSYLTIGARRGEVGTETTEHRGYFLGFYEQAKFGAEQVARSYAASGLPIVTLNPAGVYGPRDLKPTGRGFLDLLGGRVPAIFRGQPFGLVYVEDVAEAHVLAAEHGLVGERYILSERNLTTEELYRLVCDLAGTRMPAIWPGPIFRPIAEIAELGSRLTRRPPLLERDAYRLAAHGVPVDGSRAARELGLEYTPLETGLPETLKWYWEQGLLKEKPAFLNHARAG